MARSEAAVSILLIDGASASHLAAAPAGDGYAIEGYDARESGGAIDGAALRDFAETCDLAPEALYTVIPRHQATVRILTLPSHDSAEIASMVALGASEYAPYPADQLVIRHHVLSRLPSGESRVSVVLIHKDVIDQHTALLAAAGLEPRQIYFSTACIHAALSGAPEAPAGRYAAIVVSGSSLEVLVLEDNVLRFSRGVAHHAPWDVDDSTSRDALSYEVRDALAAYRRESEDGQGVNRVVVAADHGDLEALTRLVRESVDKTCQTAQFAIEQFTADQVFGAVIPLAALGAVLSAGGRAPMNVELLPPAIAQVRAMRGFQARAMRVAALVGVVLVALIIWFGVSVVQRVLLIGELREKVDALAPGAQGVAAKQQGLQAIARQVDRGGNFLELLSAVASAAPESDFNVTRIEYDRENGMNVWGRARSKDLVLGEFLGNLRRLGEGSLAQLAQAHSQYETAGRERDQAIVNYQVTIPALPEEGADDAAATLR